MSRAVTAGLAVVALLTLAAPVDAAHCMLSSSGVHFGSLSRTAARSADGLAGLLIECRGVAGEALHYEIRALGAGPAPLGRALANGSTPLRYDLFLDPAHTRAWGDGLNRTQTITATVQFAGPVYSHLYPVFAHLAAPLAAGRAQPYVDNVVIQLEY